MIISYLSKYRPNSYNLIFDLTHTQDNELRGERLRNRERNVPFPVAVPGPGLEPGWIAPTVFETVASTDSAIRALWR